MAADEPWSTTRVYCCAYTVSSGKRIRRWFLTEEAANTWAERRQGDVGMVMIPQQKKLLVDWLNSLCRAITHGPDTKED